jgi:4-amino-4-deoxy-L-arabinose transferase-like glycosyltransferase
MHEAEHRTPPQGSITPRVRAALALLLAVQLVLALAGAARKALVQDEFHTRFHASAASLGELFANLRLDNHPPLSFLLVRVSRNLLGDSELALRAPLILCGLLGTLYVARLCARLGASPLAGAALWALCSTQLEFSTQARMYGLSALCCAGALDALARLGGERPRRARAAAELALWVAAGLLTHYYWILYAAALAAALALGALVAPQGRALLRRAWPAGVLAALLCLPWYLSSFREQIASDLPPGMIRSRATDLVEVYLHLLVWNVRLGGDVLRVVFIAAAALGVALALAGLVRAWRDGRRAAALVVLALGFGVPFGAGLSAMLWGRMGFNWSYVLPSLPALVLGMAWCAGRSRHETLATGCVVVAGLCLSVLNAFAPSSEDHRAAVRWVHGLWRPGDVLYVADLQGQVFEQGMAWDYYAARVAHEFPPPWPERRLATLYFDVDDPAQLAGHARVILMAKVAEHMAILARLRELYPRETLRTFGYGVEVYTFEP